MNINSDKKLHGIYIHIYTKDRNDHRIKKAGKQMMMADLYRWLVYTLTCSHDIIM